MSIAYIRDVRKSLTSDHIIAQQANRYIVAFHIAISYDMHRPPYNRRAVGLPPTRCMYGVI